MAIVETSKYIMYSRESYTDNEDFMMKKKKRIIYRKITLCFYQHGKMV